MGLHRLVLSIIALLILSLGAQANTDQQCQTLTATGNSEYPPYLWRKGEGSKELLGANRIIIDEIAKRLGITIELQDVGSWARAQDMLKAGRIDLMAGAFFTIPRVQYMDYVHPAFLETESVVWIRNNSELDMTQKEDLKPYLGVTVINNSFGQEFDEYSKAELDIVYVSSLSQAFKMLDRGRSDFALYEKNPGMAYADILGYDELAILDTPISSEGLYLTISHRSECNTPELRGKLAKAVHEMTSEGFMGDALKQGLASWKTFNQ